MGVNGRFRFVLTGVGGQGVLTLGRTLGEAALLAGHEVVVGQLHGMSQRGGSVLCTVLLGPGTSSFVENGRADALLALEPLEALRARRFVSERTRVVLSTRPIVPAALTVRGVAYPSIEEILEGLGTAGARPLAVDAPSEVARAGCPAAAMNVLMLGVLFGAGGVPLPEDALVSAIESSGPASKSEPALLAFARGKEIGQS